MPNSLFGPPHHHHPIPCPFMTNHRANSQIKGEKKTFGKNKTLDALPLILVGNPKLKTPGGRF